MAQTLYILKYNSYRNRQIKGFASIQQYQPYIEDSQININFNPADGVSTEIILNTYDDACNYAILTNEYGDIISRWFIMECNRTRLGQYQLTLRRDVVYDHLAEIMDSIAYIEKGWVNINDSAIYNSEQLPVNQIKIGEHLLQGNVDHTPWIVGYLGSKYPSEGDPPEITWNAAVSPDSISEAEFTALSTNEYLYDLTSPSLTKYIMPSNTGIATGTFINWYYAQLNNDGALPGLIELSGGRQGSTWTIKGTNGTDFLNGARNVAYLAYSNLTPANKALAISECVTDVNSRGLGLQYNNLADHDGKTVSYGNRLYKVSFTLSGWSTEYEFADTNNALKLPFVGAVNSSDYVEGTSFTVSDVTLKIKYKVPRYKVSLIEDLSGQVKMTLPAATNRMKLKNQPYNMFCMPYGNFEFWLRSGESFTRVKSNAQACMSIAQGISAALSGTGELYDLQLLPYCPLRQYFTQAYDSYYEHVVLDDLPGSTTQYTPIKDSDNNILSYMLWSDIDTFKVNVNYSDYTLPEDPIEFKVENQSKMVRIVSPNYNGSFEFSPTKNRGITRFTVSCTYKPFQPYIKVAPEFNGLYGTNYNDNRGLICNGDFSLSQTSDAWNNYQIQNKNYQEIFGREVQSIELNNKYAKVQDIANAVTGTIQGGISGATSGALVGGGWGAAIGGIVGTVGSAAGGIADVSINSVLREDQLDLKKDLYNYSLENIRALPATLSKVGSLNADNKLFPFIEIYDCTDEEKEAIRNKIRYNGMTIARIGSPSQFTNEAGEAFIKGQIIRLDIDDDYHMHKTINDELQIGVFIDEYTR